MSKAHALLDVPDVAAVNDQPADEARKASEALANTKTSSEQEAIRLSQEVPHSHHR